MSKGAKIQNRGFPEWYKGQMLNEVHGDFWYGAREGKLFVRDGKLVDKKNFDFILEKERQEQIQSRINRHHTPFRINKK